MSPMVQSEPTVFAKKLNGKGVSPKTYSCWAVLLKIYIDFKTAMSQVAVQPKGEDQCTVYNFLNF